MLINFNKVKVVKRAKGFTLIELLAVIVILAVIALIATPIIMNVINDSKKGAAKDSMYAYVKSVELSAMKKVSATDNGINGTFDIKNGDLYDQTSKNLVLEVEIKGSKPKSGTITLGNGQVTGGNFNIDGQDITYNKDESNPSSSPVPTTSPTPAPTTTPTADPDRKYVDSWTEELDSYYPTPISLGDFETYENIKKVYPDFRCDKPLEIKVFSERFPDTPVEDLGQVFHIDLEKGFICNNNEQTGVPKMCMNYEVKILCRNYID